MNIFELMIVVAILLSLGLPVAYDFYLDYQLSSEAMILAAVFSQARNQSMVNYNEARHGVFLNTNNFVIYEGNTYVGRVAGKDVLFPRTAMVSVSGFNDLNFESLSGRTSSTTVTLSDSRKNKHIHINAEGMVDY